MYKPGLNKIANLRCVFGMMSWVCACYLRPVWVTRILHTVMIHRLDLKIWTEMSAGPEVSL